MIKNITIKDVVDTGLNGTLTISFEGYPNHVFDCNSMLDLERVTHLGRYLNVRNTDDLKGKTIRITEKNNQIICFVHPTEDKFFFASGDDDFHEFTSAEFDKYLK